MRQRFDLCILIYSKRAKVHYAHNKVQLFPKITIIKNGNICFLVQDMVQYPRDIERVFL